MPSAEDYFLNVPLYQSLDLTTPEQKTELVHIRFFVGTLDTFCVYCKQHSIFQSCTQLPDIGSGLNIRAARNVEELLQSRRAFFPFSEEDATAKSSQVVLDYIAYPRYFQNWFRCSRNDEHELFFETKVSESAFEKVGQYPSLADLHLGDLHKYRKVLGDQYSELARGIGLSAHGVGIGSFVYLRRVFERLISAAYEIASADEHWNDELYQKSRMDDKIKLLEHHLPEFVVENRAVYQIMSKGVHELNDSECREYFPAVRVALELMLDEKLELMEREHKIASSKSALSSILSKIKGTR